MYGFILLNALFLFRKVIMYMSVHVHNFKNVYVRDECSEVSGNTKH